MYSSGASRREITKSRLEFHVIASEAKQSILSLFAALWIASLRSQ
jgi:hypothetical protein